MYSFVDYNCVQITVPEHLLESYQPDQPVRAPFSVITPSITVLEEQIQIGNNLEVVSGPHKGTFWPVHSVNRLASQVHFQYTDYSLQQYDRDVPIASVAFKPHSKALQFSAVWGYDVKQGDPVVVVWRESRGRKGTTRFTLPITFFAHESPVADRDAMTCYCGKEVTIIGGQYKGWPQQHVYRGKRKTLKSVVLTDPVFVEVTNMFAQSVVQAVRARTPPLDPTDHEHDLSDTTVPFTSKASGGTSSNPWLVDEDDLTAQAERIPPYVGYVSFAAIFQIEVGWEAAYIGRHAKTEVPDPFISPLSGRVEDSHLAVRMTFPNRGAPLRQVNIPLRHLKRAFPTKKGTHSMVVKGESVGTVLQVKKASIKDEKVMVEGLTGQLFAEATLPWSQVILVEFAD
ncbi:hypothetical protein BDN67DRAFT_984219 [Paxillus ammoniavirescens]|nr:hypothetical protein BDN67DRAFT_984219 [Paxillus ammoniavirescens]